MLKFVTKRWIRGSKNHTRVYAEMTVYEEVGSSCRTSSVEVSMSAM